MLYIRNLKQALNHRLVLIKVHGIIKFNPKAWLKTYIDMNTDVRQNAKMISKTNFFKMINNAVFQKTMESERKHGTSNL